MEEILYSTALAFFLSCARSLSELVLYPRGDVSFSFFFFFLYVCLLPRDLLEVLLGINIFTVIFIDFFSFFLISFLIYVAFYSNLGFSPLSRR